MASVHGSRLHLCEQRTALLSLTAAARKPRRGSESYLVV